VTSFSPQATAYSMYFVPGASLICPFFGPETKAQIVALTGSPTLMILAAAPDTIFTEPGPTVMRVMPTGHDPRVGCSVNVAAVVVVPCPPFQVIFVPSDPFFEPGGGVFKVTAVPPALNAAGVHFERTDVAVVPTSLSVIAPQATLGLSAADAGTGVVSGIASAIAAVAAPKTRIRTETLMYFPLGWS